MRGGDEDDDLRGSLNKRKGNLGSSKVSGKAEWK